MFEDGFGDVSGTEEFDPDARHPDELVQDWMDRQNKRCSLDEALERIAALEADKKLLRQRLFGNRRAVSSDHTTACSIWGDDGQGGTPEGFQEPLPCNCGALENYEKARAEHAERELAKERARLAAHKMLEPTSVPEPDRIYNCPYCNLGVRLNDLTGTTDRYRNVCHKSCLLKAWRRAAIDAARRPSK